MAPILFTPAQAAALLQVRESWLRRRAARRAVPCTFLGKHLRFSSENLKQIASGAARPAATSRGSSVRGRRRRSVETSRSKRALTPLGAENTFSFPFSSKRAFIWNFRQRVWLPALAGNEALGWVSLKQGMHFHDLRHTHETWLIEDGVPHVLRLERLGHKRKGGPRPVFACDGRHDQQDVGTAAAPLGGGRRVVLDHGRTGRSRVSV
jgi:hypothetical protein